MTVSNTTRSVQYSGNGSTTTWPFAFAADEESLIVQVYDEELETLTTIGSGAYSVVFTTDGFSAGTVTYPLSGSPLSSTKKIVISRTLAAVQTLALGNQSTFYPALFEAALDRLVFLVQQVSDRANRSLAVRVGEAAIAELATSAESRAEKALMFDETGLVLTAGPSAGEIAGAGVAALSAATSAANALASEEVCAEIQEDLETLLAAGMAAGISFAPYEELDETDLQAAIEQLVDLVNSRILEGTANQITVTNGDGEAGAPTISLVRASEAEAQAGTDTNKVMTAERVAQAITFRRRSYRVTEQQSSGVAPVPAGPAGAAQWSIRPLSTEVFDNLPGASLSGGVVTLPAGRFEVRGRASAYNCHGHSVRLYNVTAGAVVSGLVAVGEWARSTADAHSTTAELSGEFVIGASANFRLEHWLELAPTNGFGIALGNGAPEVYASLEFTWIGPN